MSENEINQAHREKITESTELAEVKRQLSDSANLYNQELLLEIEQYLLAKNPLIQNENDRKEIAAYLSQIIEFNKDKNFGLSEKLKEVLRTFQS